MKTAGGIAMAFGGGWGLVAGGILCGAGGMLCAFGPKDPTEVELL